MKIIQYLQILVLVLTFNFLQAAPLFESGPNKVNLIELYSSEGCSSCPPADEWFSQLRKNGKLWKNFAPIAFHVDYWNYLGWTDRFSHKSFTNRQKRYSSEWGIRRIYTPGFVLNGKEFKRRSLASITEPQIKSPGKLIVSKKGKNFVSQFTPTPEFSSQLKKKKLVLNAALLGNGLSTKVPAGENAGRTLNHDFVVLDLKRSSNLDFRKEYKTEFHLKISGKIKPESMSAVFWVTESNSLKPIQVVGGDL